MTNKAKNLPAQERRIVTVEAVVKLAGTQNPSGITTAAIAKHMNLTQGALFRHFPSKESIWQAVMEWVSERLLNRIEQAAKNTHSPQEALLAMFMAHIDFVIEHPGVPRMIFGELQSAESTIVKKMVQTLIKNYSERLKKILKEGKNCGELSPNLDEQAAATLFIGTIQGLVMQSLLTGNMGQIRQDSQNVFAIYQSGIRNMP